MRISDWSSDVCSSDLMVDRAPWLDLAAATALADPQLDLATPMKGPFAAIPVIAPDLAAAALQLARIAGILPAFFVRTDAADSEVSITPADIAAHEAAARLTIAARAPLPVEGAETAEIVAFRTPAMPRSEERRAGTECVRT